MDFSHGSVLRVTRRVKRGGLALALLTAGPALAGSVTYRPIALSGTDGALGPGQGAAVVFSTLGQQQPAINATGQVAFRGTTSLGGGLAGMWLHSGASNSNFGIAGGPQPGGGTYPAAASFNNIGLNNAGNLSWRLGASTGTFSDVGGGPARVALAGDSAPGTTNSGPLASYSGVTSASPLLNAAGQSAVIGNLAVNAALDPPVVISGATANFSGIWVGTPGGTSLLMRQNDAMLALDGSGNTRVGALQQLTMAFNGGGRFVLATSLQGSNVVTGTGAGSNSAMIASNRTGSVEALARVGNAAPNASGAPSATDLFRSFGAGGIAFNNAGHVAFSSSLRDAAGTQTATGALFSDLGSGTLREIARVGNALPTIVSPSGSPLAEFNGVTWGQSYNNTMLSGSDMLVFAATGLGNTGGTNNTGAILTLDSAGTFTKVQRNGDVAIAGGAPDGSDAFFLSPSSIQLNSLGQIAFATTLTGVGVSPGLGNGSAIFATADDGSLCLVARTGDQFEVAPGDFRTIQTLGGLTSSGGQDGRLMNLNDNGDLVFELDFVGGTSGIFVAHIPEPTAAAMLLVLTLGVIRKRN